MSYYLYNPGGRMVAVETDEEYQDLLKKGTFKIPSEKEIREHIEKRLALFKSQDMASFEQKYSVHLITVTGGSDGYGQASKKLLEELTKLDVKVSTYNKGQKIGLLFHAPYGVMKIENPVKIIYTMFESDQIPDDWPELLNTADRVIVPSRWNMEVFAKKGVNAEVVPLGYDDNVFTYKDRELKSAKHETFSFLHYNAYNLRKGFDIVLKAFVKAFDKSEPVKMIFKTTLTDLPLPLPPSQYPNIETLTGQYSDYDLAALCGRADCFVFPSRGEGFGITPLEAMATGLPAIIPNASGMTEYFNPKYMYEVKIKGECPPVYARYRGRADVGHMVEPDVDDLASKMRYIYEHQDEALRKGAMASDYVKQWTYQKTARALSTILNEYFNKPVVPRPLSNVLVLEEVK